MCARRASTDSVEYGLSRKPAAEPFAEKSQLGQIPGGSDATRVEPEFAGFLFDGLGGQHRETRMQNAKCKMLNTFSRTQHCAFSIMHFIIQHCAFSIVH
jgi:hypothetical protein